MSAGVATVPAPAGSPIDPTYGGAVYVAANSWLQIGASFALSANRSILRASGSEWYLDTQGYSFTVPGSITNISGTPYGLHKTGTGTLVLTGNNSGGLNQLIINAGTVSVAADNSIGAASTEFGLVTTPRPAIRQPCNSAPLSIRPRPTTSLSGTATPACSTRKRITSLLAASSAAAARARGQSLRHLPLLRLRRSG